MSHAVLVSSLDGGEAVGAHEATTCRDTSAAAETAARAFDNLGIRLIIAPMFDKDLDSMPLADLEAEICGWAGRLAAATCAWLLAIAAFDRRDGWGGVGIKSCAHWLSWRCGTSARTASEQLRVGRALERLPAVREAFAAGKLSYSKVRAITRVAEPADEAEWARQAYLMTAGQLERLVATMRRLRADPDAARRASEGGRCWWRWDEDGNLRLSAKLPPDQGAALVAAINAANASLGDSTPPDVTDGQDQDGEQDGKDDGEPGRSCEKGPAVEVTDELRRTVPGRADSAASLVALAEAFLSTGAPALANPGRHAVTVLVDARLLDDSFGQAGKANAEASDRQDCGQGGPGGPGRPPCCQVGPGVGLHPETARRLACDSVVTTLLTDPGGNPLAVGRARRTPPARLRTALLARDMGCTFPNCDHTRWLHAHHIEHWGKGGRTDLDNLTLLCSQHHRAVHEGGISLHRQPDGTVVAILRDGRLIHPAPPIDAGARPLDDIAGHTGHVDDETIVPRWYGDPLDLNESLTALYYAAKASRIGAA